MTALHNIQADFTLYSQSNVQNTVASRTHHTAGAKLMSGFEEIIKDSYWETPLPLAALETSLISGEVDVLVMVTCECHASWRNRSALECVISCHTHRALKLMIS